MRLVHMLAVTPVFSHSSRPITPRKVHPMKKKSPPKKSPSSRQSATKAAKAAKPKPMSQADARGCAEELAAGFRNKEKGPPMSNPPLPPEVQKAMDKLFLDTEAKFNKVYDMLIDTNKNISKLIDKLKEAGVFK